MIHTNPTPRGVIAPLLALAMAAAGCASTNPDLERARATYVEAASDAELASRASVELYEAQKTLSDANAAWELLRSAEETQHLSYITERKIDIARVAAERKSAEAVVEQLTQQRDRFVLEARTREADSARVEADTARAEAERRAREAELRAREAESARQAAEAAQSRAAELEKELAEVGARATDRGYVLTLGDVLFDLNRAELRPGALRNLYRLVTFLNTYGDRSVLIEGHTDSTGDDAYNQGLSERRAQAVRTFLIENGIVESRAFAKGYGEAFPVASNDANAGRQQNRRVEVVILEPGERPEDRVLRR